MAEEITENQVQIEWVPLTQAGILKVKLPEQTVSFLTELTDLILADDPDFEGLAYDDRLAGQIQRNMGRPALINRTGRFAQSANVVSAVGKPNGLHLDYTYNPLYKVFEDGQGSYSSNYDPRPLIEKSIRELAAQKIETKFTLRRV